MPCYTFMVFTASVLAHLELHATWMAETIEWGALEWATPWATLGCACIHKL